MGEKCERTRAEKNVKLLDVGVRRVLAVLGESAKIERLSRFTISELESPLW